jgi:hypothetical protein
MGESYRQSSVSDASFLATQADDGTIEAGTTPAACRASARACERGCRFAVIRTISQRAALLSGDCAVMTFSLILLGGITSVVLVIALVDWLGRRKDRASHHRAA